MRGGACWSWRPSGGGTVWDRFRNQGLDLATSCALALATCSAVQHAHEHGVLHRDIKPENLLFAGSGDLKVTDFGIAKVLSGSKTLATVDGSVLGTPAYMAPEQAEGATVGPPADVYAIGSMLYEFATGRLPFEGDTPMAMLVQRLTAVPPPVTDVAPSVAPGVAEVITTSLARDPSDRFVTAEELGDALGRAAVAAWGPEWLERTGVNVLGSRRIMGSATGAGAEVSVGPARAPRAPNVAPPAPPTVAPGQDAAPPTVAPGQEAASATVTPSESVAPPVVRPVVEGHPAGLAAGVERADLVDIDSVIRTPGLPVLTLLVGIVAIVAGILVALLAPSQPEPLDPPTALVVNGQPAGTATPVEIDPTEVVVIAGVDAAAIRVGVEAFGLPLGTQSAVTADGFSALELGVAGYVVAGPFTLTVTPEGGPAEATVAVQARSQRASYLSAFGVGAVVVLAFALAAAESNLRRLRRRLRPGALVGVAVAGFAAGVAGTALMAIVTGNPVGPGGPALAGALLAVGGVAIGIAGFRLSRRARLRRLSALAAARARAVAR